jgi:hypothetical protein
MAGNLTALATIWATYPSTMSTDVKLAQLNGTMVAGPAKDVSRSEIKKILQVSGALAKMQAYVANPAGAQNHDCLVATNYLLALVSYEATLSDVIATSDPTNLNTVNGLVPSLTLEAANGLTTAIVAQITALITPLVPWWKANGFTGPVLVSDLIAAGNLI